MNTKATIPSFTLIALLALGGKVQADLVVSGGHLVVQDGSLRVTGEVTVQDPAVLSMANASASLIMDVIHVLVGGTLRGCGTLVGEVWNEGEILADCGSAESITFDGNVTNDGTVRAANGNGILQTNGTFTNSGVLDLIFGSNEPPVTLTGAGVVLTAQKLPLMNISLNSEGVALVSFQAYRPYRYRVERSETLAPDSWELLWSDDDAVTETHTRLIEDHSAVGRPECFYRYGILE